MSRDIKDLIPILACKALDLIAEVQKRFGIDILIYRTWASFAEQHALYEQGRVVPGSKCNHNGRIWEIGTCDKHPLGLIITNGDAGESCHNYALAFDYGILRPNSKQIEWAGKIDVNDDEIPDYQQVGELGEDMGLEWGGRFHALKGDLGHLQMSFGFKCSELLALFQGYGMKRVWDECMKKYKQRSWL